MMYEADRRAAARVKVAIPARLELKVPKDPVEFVELHVNLHDLNELGCLARTELKEDLYTVMRTKTSTGYVDFRSVPGLPGKIFGKAVLIQLHTQDDEGVVYSIGLYFENLPKPFANTIRTYLKEHWIKDSISEA